MAIQTKLLEQKDHQIWDSYVKNHPESNLYHLSGWKNVVENTYGRKTYYLIASRSSQLKARSSKFETGGSKAESRILNASKNYELSATNYELNTGQVAGVLPLVHLKHFLFGNSLVSMPYFDMGGILADNEEIEKALLTEAVNLGQELKVENIELRHIKPLKFFADSSKLKAHSLKQEFTNSNALTMSDELSAMSYVFQTQSHKVRMLLKLPEAAGDLMQSFKSKLRSQIKKPIKEGLTSTVGCQELLGDFYNVFSINMRDLGSPVHAKKLIANVLMEFPNNARLILIYKEKEPVAGSVIVGFKDTLLNPWSSALKKYNRLSPNMLLYWSMLEYACNKGFRFFDFGRSVPGEGTYKFKSQWGAEPERLYWQYVSLNGESLANDENPKGKYVKIISIWQNLPITVTKLIGPLIRKHIGL